jgi:hypothetical protein
LEEKINSSIADSSFHVKYRYLYSLQALIKVHL